MQIATLRYWDIIVGEVSEFFVRSPEKIKNKERPFGNGLFKE